MKSIFLILISLTAVHASAGERLLVCANNDASQPQHLEIRYEAQQLEPTGQVTKAPYLVVNLICNNAGALIELKKDILCAGVERGNGAEPGKVITETIVSTPSGYRWNGLKCL